MAEENEGAGSVGHKRKAWPSWRVVLTDFVIVVLGVGVALAAQQAAERWSEHQQYLASRQAMLNELDFNVSNMSRRDEFEPCIRRRLDEIRVLLDRAESHQPFEAPRWIGYGQGLRLLFIAEPEAGRSNLFTTAEQSRFGRLYGNMHTLATEQDREIQAWTKLRMLEGRSSLSSEMIYGLRSALADAEAEHHAIELLRTYLAYIAREAGIHSVTNARAQGASGYSWQQCLPMNTPKEEAERRTQIVLHSK